MAILLVTYDLNKDPGSDDYTQLLAAIKSERNWAQLSESCYAMDTALTPKGVYDMLAPHLDPGDSLLVFTLDKPYFGQHSQEVVDWLGKKM